MIGLDTNVIVRYLTQDDPGQAARATEVFHTLTDDQPGFVPTLVWAELYWVLTRSYGISASDVVDRLAALAEADEIRAESPSGVARAVAATRRGADFADALIDASARHAACQEVVTFDRRAAGRLGWSLA